MALVPLNHSQTDVRHGKGKAFGCDAFGPSTANTSTVWLT
jgi:hypothetical protein